MDPQKSNKITTHPISHTRSAIPRSPTMKGIPAYSLLVKVAWGVFQRCVETTLEKKNSLLHPHLSRLLGTARMPRRFPRGGLIRRGPKGCHYDRGSCRGPGPKDAVFVPCCATKCPEKVGIQMGKLQSNVFIQTKNDSTLKKWWLKIL